MGKDLENAFFFADLASIAANYACHDRANTWKDRDDNSTISDKSLDGKEELDDKDLEAQVNAFLNKVAKEIDEFATDANKEMQKHEAVAQATRTVWIALSS